MPVAELEHRMSRSEFTEWMAFLKMRDEASKPPETLDERAQRLVNEGL